MNRKALLVAVLCAAVGLVLLMMYQDQFKRRVGGGSPVPVLVAVQDIALGEPLTEAKLGLRSIPEAYVDDRHIRRSDLSRVLNVRVSMGIRANQAVLWTDLATSSDARRDLSSLVRPGMRAVTIRADQTSTFGGLIRPGDRVDVMATIQRTERGGAATNEGRFTMPLMPNLLVLAAGRDTGGEAAQARGSQGAAGAVSDTSQVTLSATMPQAQVLIFAQEYGRLSLVLRNPEDIAVTAGMPEVSIQDIMAQLRDHARPSAPTPPPVPAAPAPVAAPIEPEPRGGDSPRRPHR